MATVEELVQMMNTLQGQQHALNQEISRLTAENQQFRQAGSPGLAEIATAVGQAVQTAISNANPRSSERQSLVDIKGLGKPPTFKGGICEIHRVAQEDHGVSDCCVWLSFPASDRVGGRSRQHSSRTKHLINSSVRWVRKQLNRSMFWKSEQVERHHQVCTETFWSLGSSEWRK